MFEPGIGHQKLILSLVAGAIALDYLISD